MSQLGEEWSRRLSKAWKTSLYRGTMQESPLMPFPPESTRSELSYLESGSSGREVSEAGIFRLPPGSKVPRVKENRINIHLSLHFGKIHLAKRSMVRRDHNSIRTLSGIEN